MTVLTALPEVNRTAVMQVKADIGVALSEVIDPDGTFVDALAQFNLTLDRIRLQKLKNSAAMVLALRLPVLEVDSLSGLDPAALGQVLRGVDHVQTELAVLFDVIAKSSDGSVHPRVKDWAEVIRVAARTLFDGAEAMRWELLEAEADADIAAGRVMRFASTENAVAYLRRIGK